MKVRVIYIGRIRAWTGLKEEVIDAERGVDVWQLLERLAEGHGRRFQKALFENGELAPGLNILVNGVNITKRVRLRVCEEMREEGLETPPPQIATAEDGLAMTENSQALRRMGREGRSPVILDGAEENQVELVLLEPPPSGG